MIYSRLGPLEGCPPFGTSLAEQVVLPGHDDEDVVGPGWENGRIVESERSGAVRWRPGG